MPPLPTTPTTTVASAAVDETPSRPGAANPSGHPNTTANPATEPSPGTSRPAQPGSVTNAPITQSPATAGRPGPPGAAGYPGMIPPGIHSRKEDDDRHKTPRFLRTEEHAEELIGEVEPTVPPVIGAE